METNTKALTVSQLSKYIKQIFDAEELLFNINVVGEISGLSIVRGVAYFILKDESASLSCVCFSLDDFNFKNGDSVIVTGTPRYYAKGGKLNFNVVKIAQNGIGELYKQFTALKEKLEKLGYFDKLAKKPMPTDIKRIGVVTSKEGAVIQDIINVRNRRNPYIDIVIYPVKVQGVNAEKEIAKGVKFFENYDVDLIIVARGGGSIEDLQPFNTEYLADTIHNCTKFVMSAVGHETDFTICDFVSDKRAPTPSVASELCCLDVEEQKNKCVGLIQRLAGEIREFYFEKNQQFYSLTSAIIQTFKTISEIKHHEINEILLKLKNSRNIILMQKEHKLNVITATIGKLDPNKILKLGYAVAQKNGNTINSVNGVQVGDEIKVKVQDGEFMTNVTKIKGENVWVLKIW